MRHSVGVLVLLCHLVTVIYALYEDQAGKWDWRMQYVGRVVNMQSNGRLLFVASELNVVAALNAASGAIVWRHVLESGVHMKSASRLVLEGSELLHVSQDNVVRCWTANKGVLKWQTTLNAPMGSEFVGISLVDSSWIFVTRNGDTLNKFVYDSEGQLISDDSNKINAVLMCEISSHHVICISTSGVYALSLTDFANTPKLIANSGTRIFHVSQAEGLSNYFVVEEGQSCTLFESKQKNVNVAHKFDAMISAISIHTQNEKEYLSVVGESSNKVQFYNMQGFNHQSQFDIVLPDKRPLQKIVMRPGNNDDIIVIYEDAAIAQINRKKSDVTWCREESLAYILGVEMLDLPLSEGQATIEEEFDDHGEGIIRMLQRRLTSQALQIQRTLLQTVENIVGLPNLIPQEWKHADSSYSSNAMTRDLFNLRKMVVFATESAKIFGIDSESGTMVWSLQLDLVPLTEGSKKSLTPFVLRSTAHYPFPAIVTFVGKNPMSGLGRLVSIDPMLGTVTETMECTFAVRHILQLQQMNAHSVRGLALVGKGKKEVMLYPYDVSMTSSVHVLSAVQESNTLSGAKLSHNAQEQYTAWQAKLSPNQRILNVYRKKFSEQIHSQGRVLGDRNVLYKYSNPHLVAITSLSTNINDGGTDLHVDLVDSVTGLTVFSAVHVKATQPVSVVHCENWVVYSYWNSKLRRTEVAVLELYEGRSQASPDVFSSSMPTLQTPMVLRQGYIFPQGVTAMGVSDTEMGMTNRHILMAMPFGGILQVPKAFLDPRRVMEPMTVEEREEGIMPYIPELRIATEHILNYNQTLLRINSIHAAPTGLESTSLVVAYGLDMYLTRLTPSGTFDVLKDDFDHWIISSVLVALFVASIVTKRLAKHRDLKQAWR